MNSENGKSSEKAEAGNKFKFALLQLDKRLVNLELALGELSEKVKGIKTIDMETAVAIKERLDDLEDLIMVENLGGVELKTVLEGINSRIDEISQRTATLSKDMKSIEEIKTRLEQLSAVGDEIGKLRDRIGPLETTVVKKVEDDIAALKEKTEQLVMKTDLKKIESDVKRLQERVSSIILPTEQIAELADEISFLKQKVNPLESLEENITPLKGDVIRLKEKVKFLETSLPTEKIGNLEDEIIGLREKTNKLMMRIEETAARPAEIPASVEKRLEALEDSISSLPQEMIAKIPTGQIASLNDEVTNLRDKVGSLENSVMKKMDERFAGFGREILGLRRNMQRIAGLEQRTNNLKNDMSMLNEKVQQIAGLEQQVSNLTNDVSELNEKIVPLETNVMKKISERFAGFGREITGLREKMQQMAGLEQQVSNLRNEISGLNEKIVPLETNVIQGIASEVAAVRAEMSREVKDIKDKIGGIGATKSDIDIKFLSSRLNSLKESVDYLVNRKTEIDMKMENFQKALGQVAMKAEEVASRPLEVPPSIEHRLEALEHRINDLPGEIFENFQAAMSRAAVRTKHPAIEVQQLKSSGSKSDRSMNSLNKEIDELLEKIDFLEDKLRILETRAGKSGKGEPVVVE